MVTAGASGSDAVVAVVAVVVVTPTGVKVAVAGITAGRVAGVATAGAVVVATPIAMPPLLLHDRHHRHKCIKTRVRTQDSVSCRHTSINQPL